MPASKYRRHRAYRFAAKRAIRRSFQLSHARQPTAADRHRRLTVLYVRVTRKSMLWEWRMKIMASCVASGIHDHAVPLPVCVTGSIENAAVNSEGQQPARTIFGREPALHKQDIAPPLNDLSPRPLPNGSLTGTYRRCSHLASTCKAVPATPSLPFRPLPVATRGHAN